MPGKILVIEDNPTNLELMAYPLTAFQYTVSSAMDGGEGLEEIRRNAPDLVVCDIQLPTVNGYQVAKTMKADAQMRSIPLIAVTALAMVGDRDRVLSAGFDGYIEKPIAPETFVEQVESFLRADQRSQQNPTQHGVAEAAEAEVSGRQSPRQAEILIIDDLEVNIRLMKTLLEPFGYRLNVASSIAQALLLCERTNPDLILTDIHLVDGTGFHILEHIRTQAHLRHTPAIVISGSAEPAEVRRAMEAGASKFLQRPVEPERLLEEIAAALKTAELFKTEERKHGDHTGG
jgi:two-component system cell cycle response regulator